jgi:hypothetical protein
MNQTIQEVYERIWGKAVNFEKFVKKKHFNDLAETIKKSRGFKLKRDLAKLLEVGQLDLTFFIFGKVLHDVIDLVRFRGLI